MAALWHQQSASCRACSSCSISVCYEGAQDKSMADSYPYDIYDNKLKLGDGSKCDTFFKDRIGTSLYNRECLIVL